MKLTMIRTLSLGFLLIGVIGCGSAGVKDSLDGEEAKPQLLDTTSFIPVQQYDEKTAAYLPYIAAENPYLLQKGKINKDAVTKFIQARRLFKAGNYQQVSLLLDEVISLDASLSGPWVMKGDIENLQENLTPAIEHYDKAISVNPLNINAYIRKAKAQRILGQFVLAQNTYAAALAVWPDFPEAHLNLGILYDIYLNHPLRAQKHMEAYQFLTDGKDQKVTNWINEIQGRTGVKASLTTQ